MTAKRTLTLIPSDKELEKIFNACDVLNNLYNEIMSYDEKILIKTSHGEIKEIKEEDIESIFNASCVLEGCFY